MKFNLVFVRSVQKISYFTISIVYFACLPNKTNHKHELTRESPETTFMYPNNLFQ